MLYLRSAYPFATVQYDVRTLDMTDLNRLPACDEVNNRLLSERIIRQQAGEHPLTRYYGSVLHTTSGLDGGNYMRGCTNDVSVTTWAASGPSGDPRATNTFLWDTEGSYGDWYAAHEIGHTFGRYHANFCGAAYGTAYPYPNGTIGGPATDSIRYFGFDVNRVIVRPPTWLDTMSYCDTLWISDFTYRGILSQAQRESVASQTQSARRAATASTKPTNEVLYLSGFVAADGNVTIDLLNRVPMRVSPDAPTPGDLTLQLIGQDGSVLSEHTFGATLGSEQDLADPGFTAEQKEAASKFITQEAAVSAKQHFNLTVPFVAGTREIRILRNGTIVFSRTQDPEASKSQLGVPTVMQDTTQLTVTWHLSASQASGMKYSVLFSRDGGAAYVPIRTDIALNAVTVQLQDLPVTQMGKIRVVGSDGLTSVQADASAVIVITKSAASRTVQVYLPLIARYDNSHAT